MTADTKAGATFRLRPVLASIGEVIRSHYAILGLLAVILHFVAWRFVGELRRSFVDYAAEGFRLDLPQIAGGFIATWSAAVPDPLSDAVDPLFAEYLSTTAAVNSLYLVLMQVAVTTLMSAGLPPPGGAGGERAAASSANARPRPLLAEALRREPACPRTVRCAGSGFAGRGCRISRRSARRLGTDDCRHNAPRGSSFGVLLPVAERRTR